MSEHTPEPEHDFPAPVDPDLINDDDTGDLALDDDPEDPEDAGLVGDIVEDDDPDPDDPPDDEEP